MSDFYDGPPDIILCSVCGKSVPGYRTARYEHQDCEEPQVDEARVREARRVGYERTASLLHRLGHHAEAAWHEKRGAQ